MSEETPRELDPSAIPDIRRAWHNGAWYFAIADIIAFLLPDNDRPDNYWRVLKSRLRDKEEAQETLDSIEQLRLQAKDKKFRLIDVATRQVVFRLLQSIPSPRVEPFKLWLAQVGEERFEEIEHPELAIERVRQTYRAKGYDDAWIEERIKNDLTRNALTDEWKDRGAKEGTEFAILTNTIHEGTFDITIQAHKKYKLLPTKANLRDHMIHLELALTSLSEATAITLHQDRDSQEFTQLKQDATDAGEFGGDTRRRLEERIGHPVVSSQNYLENTKRKHQQRMERQQQPSLFDDESNRI